MPPSSTFRGGRFRPRTWFFLTLAATAIALAVTAGSLGHLLYEEDPLDRADAIYVLAGSWLERVAEAGDLYREGRAPVILLSRELPDAGEEALRARGLDVPSVNDVQVAALEKMGVPKTAVTVTEPQIATASEAEALKAIAAARGWHRVIVVTSKYHTGRAHLVFSRRLQGSDVQVIMHATKYDSWDPDHWAANRVHARIALIEFQKLVLYWLHLAD